MGDVARHLGVSRQLVSIVFRDAPGASAETRQRVREVAAQLGYRPDISAQTLRSNSSKYLGLVFTVEHSAEAGIVANIYRGALKYRYNVVLSTLTETRDMQAAVDQLLGYRCEALVVIGAQRQSGEVKKLAQRLPVPLVSVGWGRRNDWYDVVRSAGDKGIEQAVHHLYGFGHRDILYVHCEHMPPAGIRLRGYRRAVKTLSLEPQVVVMSGNYTEEAGASAARQLLAEGSLPTAIVMGNDQAALGLIHTLIAGGLRIPQDVSVTGYDDSYIAQWSFMNLTSASQDPILMSEAAVEAAIRRIRQPSAEPEEFVIPSLLVVRGSTAGARNGEWRRRRRAYAVGG
jgi:DNA-binding LacI/PurR family transcriptional regulator